MFLADTSRPGETTVYFAREGRIRLDEANRIVQLELREATSYTSTLDRPDEYVANAIGTTLISLDPETVFKRPPAKGAPEMTIAELKAEIAAAKTRNDPGYGARFMLQQKFSLPLTCPHPRADRVGPGREQPQGRKARQLRGRHGRDLRVLRPALGRPGSRDGWPVQP